MVVGAAAGPRPGSRHLSSSDQGRFLCVASEVGSQWSSGTGSAPTRPPEHDPVKPAVGTYVQCCELWPGLCECVSVSCSTAEKPYFHFSDSVFRFQTHFGEGDSAQHATGPGAWRTSSCPLHSESAVWSCPSDTCFRDQARASPPRHRSASRLPFCSSCSLSLVSFSSRLSFSSFFPPLLLLFSGGAPGWCATARLLAPPEAIHVATRPLGKSAKSHELAW